jgi:hypothetical protein
LWRLEAAFWPPAWPLRRRRTRAGKAAWPRWPRAGRDREHHDHPNHLTFATITRDIKLGRGHQGAAGLTRRHRGSLSSGWDGRYPNLNVHCEKSSLRSLRILSFTDGSQADSILTVLVITRFKLTTSQTGPLHPATVGFLSAGRTITSADRRAPRLTGKPRSDHGQVASELESDSIIRVGILILMMDSELETPARGLVDNRPGRVGPGRL